MTTRFTSMTAQSTVTSSDSAKNSRSLTTPSTLSKHSMASDTAIGKRESFAHLRMTPEAPLSRRFSALAWRILLFNGFALPLLIGGVLFVQPKRVGLVVQRLYPHQAQARSHAAGIAG